MLNAWASLYANSALLRTLIGFAHIAGLVVGGGCAIVADRATLKAFRRGSTSRDAEIDGIRSAHRVVLAGLALVMASGVLLLGADFDTFIRSKVFWIKMGLVALLLLNGAALARLGAAPALDDRRWTRLAYVSGFSLALWLLTTLTGAALPNVG